MWNKFDSVTSHEIYELTTYHLISHRWFHISEQCSSDRTAIRAFLSPSSLDCFHTFLQLPNILSELRRWFSLTDSPHCGLVTNNSFKK